MYTELVFSHEALEPAPGTDNKNRACMPYPFTGQLSGGEAGNELRLLIDGFRKSAQLGSGAARPHPPAGATCAGPSSPRTCATALGCCGAVLVRGWSRLCRPPLRSGGGAVPAALPAWRAGARVSRGARAARAAMLGGRASGERWPHARRVG